MKLNTHSPLLEFGSNYEKLRDALSVVIQVGEYLWLASDETTSVERLSTEDGHTFKNHKSFSLAGLIDLPAYGIEDIDQEIDIEGIAYQSPYLWIVGSHSIKRKKIEKEDSGSIEKKIKKLAKTEAEGNRYILARIPLVENAETKELELLKSAQESAAPTRTLTAAQLPGDVKSNTLLDALKGKDQIKADPHLEQYLSIPGKDNGFDIEGLAVAGEKIFLGLRGPVLRGWAIILEIAVDVSDSSRLTLKRIGPEDRPYKKHFLQLGGLGIRDLSVDGTDLLILAGPTMDLDEPVAVFRWKDGVNSSEESLVWKENLKRLNIDVPHGQGEDHAEGMTLILATDRSPSVLIVYDSPSALRKEGDTAVRADVFELPQL